MKARCFQIKMMKLLKEQEDMNMTENMMDIGDIDQRAGGYEHD